MKWDLKDPVCGDIIRVKAGSIYHYGIYISDAEVIQFGLSPMRRIGLSDAEVSVCVSDIEAFLSDGFLEIGVPEKKDKKRFPPKKTVALARSRLGEKGYNIIYNNCEHFAYECYCGEKFCSQTAEVRELFKKMPIVDVYVAQIPGEGKIAKVYPHARQNEIKATASDVLKRERYYVWKLLEYGLKRSFGKKITDVEFQKQASGKWSCDVCEFSLSHSKNAVCVVISRAPVGIDIEKIKSPKADISKDVLSPEEFQQYEACSAEEKENLLIHAWTKKESLFKMKNEGSISVEAFRMQSGSVFQTAVQCAGESYSLSVATQTPEKVRLYEGIDLSF